LEIRIIRLEGAELELIRNMLRLKDIKTKSQTSLGLTKLLGEKRRTKRRGEPEKGELVESCNHLI